MKAIFDKRRHTRKKKKLCLLWWFAIILLFSAVFVPSAVAHTEASEGEDGINSVYKQEIENSILEQLGELDLSELQAYFDGLTGGKDENIAERLLAFMKGDGFDFADFGEALIHVFFAKVQELLPSFACIAAISLLSGLISTLKSDVNTSTTSETIHLIAYAAALVPMLSILISCFQSAMDCVSALHKQTTVLFPLMLTLISASGGTVSAAICRPAVAFFATTIVSIVQAVVFPVSILIVAFSLASHLSKQLKIEKFSHFFKSVNKWIVGVCASVFGVFFTVQGLTSASYDGVARQAAKYAIGNGVPIIGGFLSGGFDLAVAGSILIKNALGGMGIALLVFTLLEPLVLLITTDILLRLVAAITQPFGDSQISDFLTETADNLRYCLAGMLLTAFLYFLSVVFMLCCTEAIL